MTKAQVLIALLFFFLTTTNLSAQTSGPATAIKQAKRDVLRFRLDKTTYQKFKKDRLNADADYFKPLKSMVRDTTLLSDSNYVKAFRNTAYRKTKSRQLNNSIYIVGGTAIVVTVGAIIILLTKLGDDVSEGLNSIVFPM